MNLEHQIENLARIGVLTCWGIFILIFLLRRRPPKQEDVKSEPGARSGIAIQGAAFFLVWFFQRDHITLSIPTPELLILFFSITSVPLAIASVLLVSLSIRELGKEWSLAARIVAGHRLVTTGPYALVRNPIYAGMMGIMTATGFAFTIWPAVCLAIPLFLAGTRIRVAREEKLLRSEFGKTFDEYAERTPSLFPFVGQRETSTGT
jgi:protein-S-isoprenylcysteine O-methyltransferase Ste14